MAQAGAAYYYTASVQPIKPRSQKTSGGSKYGVQPAGVRSEAERRNLTGSGSDGRTAGNGGAGKKVNTASAKTGRKSAQKPQRDFRENPVHNPTGSSYSGKSAASVTRPASKSPVNGKKTASGKHSPSAAPKKHSAPQTSRKKREAERRRRILEMRRRERINRTMLGITGGLIVAALFVYISRMAELSALSKQADALRTEITQIEEQKQYKEVEFAESRNPTRIRDAALGRLGMVEPSPEQIRYISIGE